MLRFPVPVRRTYRKMPCVDLLDEMQANNAGRLPEQGRHRKPGGPASNLMQRWAAGADLGGGFESMCQLEHAAIAVMASDDLHTDGQAAAGKCTWNGYGWIAHNRDVVRRFHPGDVIFHFRTGD